MRINPSTYLLRKIQVGAKIFSGIRFGRIFIQIATFENEVVYESESLNIKGIESRNLMELIESMFSVDFFKTEIKISKNNYRFYDGQGIRVDGGKDIGRCSSVKNTFTGFTPELFPIWE